MQRRTSGIVLLQPIINMRKSFLYILCFAVACQLIGCGSGEEQRRQLTELEQQNHSGQPMLNDTLAETLVNYFDRHGSANERMRAKYILGRTYYCLGELPRALETYYEAADCADTTASDCDFAKLSRVYAQRAAIYYDQIQPLSQLENLRYAEYYAMKGRDTLMAIDCYALQVDPYKLWDKWDSIVYITETSSERFSKIGRKDRAVQILYNELSALVKIGNYAKAKKTIDLYETQSGFFDEENNIKTKYSIYYYVKGLYYLYVNKIDSAENLFRRVMVDGNNLNNKIAGCNGLQKVYMQKRNSDSIAKYASLCYEYNDSAYLLSEMLNIQKLQASYNYNHHKLQAKEKVNEVRNAYIVIGIIVLFILFATLIMCLWFRHHRLEQYLKESLYQQALRHLEQAQSELMELEEKNDNISDLINNKSKQIENLQAEIAQYKKNLVNREKANLENQLLNAQVTKDLAGLLKANPIQSATQSQLRDLRKLINELIPSFYQSVNEKQVLRSVEYEVCLLIRCHFKPAAISKLLDRDDAYISNLRKGILLKIYGIKGSPKDLDERIMQIV